MDSIKFLILIMCAGYALHLRIRDDKVHLDVIAPGGETSKFKDKSITRCIVLAYDAFTKKELR